MERGTDMTKTCEIADIDGSNKRTVTLEAFRTAVVADKKARNKCTELGSSRGGKRTVGPWPQIARTEEEKY